MSRIFPLATAVIAAGVLCGCHMPTPKIDPYAGFGPPRVSPPTTGSWGSNDPYYTGQRTSAVVPAASPTVTNSGAGNFVPTWNSTPIGNFAPAGSAAPASGFPPNGTLAPPRSTTAGPFQSPDFASAGPAQTSQPTFASPIPTFSTTAAPVGTGVRPGGVVPATYEMPAAAAPEPTSIRARLDEQRVPLNDATSLAEPRHFIPPDGAIEISQLPNAARPLYNSPSPIRGLEATSTGLPPRSLLPPPPLSGTSSDATASSSTESSELRWRRQYTPAASAGAATR